MKEVIKITTSLTLVCLICALALALVYGVAKVKIELNEKKMIQDAIIRLAPGAQRIERLNEIYKLLADNGKLEGYAFLAQGQGYQGKIKILSVIDSNLKKLVGIEIIESVETPGLGAKIQEDEFRNQFKELNTLPAIECVKEEAKKDYQIKAITGATVSSRAVVSILNKRIEKLKEELGK
ncbi:MAG: FMN-binding protein [Candidatus Omnitrophota bacterium]|nr:MAG: FMN-binding protein [Candidatus Omnitrophota bacterium]